ncbi:GGDEF domain-containing protein [Shumkonia mesophila]|uniref:GGDEF domain-containing protein n=1 Tax=Shumkonia mesophila TaxID=2838854 RepID=UPI00293465D5|nr:GGDEF domain-containing protein [Shumkonia mesophila]
MGIEPLPENREGKGTSPAGLPRWGWDYALERLDFAFQPIVNIHNGVCFGYEALLRNWADAGFDSIRSVFDTAAATQRLNRVEAALREKAIRRFASIGGGRHFKLFYNVDNRCMAMPDYRHGVTSQVLEQNGLAPSSLYLEISEHHDLSRASQIEAILTAYRAQGYKLVIDDYGTGFSQLKMLYHCQPDVIKIDRFFVSGIDSDKRKEMLVAQQVDLAHLMGALVVAEGVETEAEFYVCKRVGCDLVQGYFIQRPTQSLAELMPRYGIIEDLAKRDRRSAGRDDGVLVRSRMTAIQALLQETTPSAVLRYFQRFRDTRVVPVVDGQGCPVGIIREADFKEFSYSLYGRELLQNPHLRPNLGRFLRRCPAVEETEPVEQILKVFANADTKEGVIVTRKMSYVGFLEGHALLEMLNEKNTIAARDQNPLTQLPGNNAIYRYVSQVLASDGWGRHFVYFDFDNFKPFNDRFGFRQGDRAILLFAEILGKKLIGGNWFVGHIGGDDFFVGADRLARDDILARISALVEDFGAQITSFYDAESRANGHIEGADRAGQIRRFPLMTVSAAILELPEVRTTLSVDDVAPAISELKKRAKRRDDHLAVADLVAFCAV